MRWFFTRFWVKKFCDQNSDTIWSKSCACRVFWHENCDQQMSHLKMGNIYWALQGSVSGSQLDFFFCTCQKIYKGPSFLPLWLMGFEANKHVWAALKLFLTIILMKPETMMQSILAHGVSSKHIFGTWWITSRLWKISF